MPVDFTEVLVASAVVVTVGVFWFRLALRGSVEGREKVKRA
jgi:hypothetical protein